MFSAVASTGPLILAIDQGTSSTKALLVDGAGQVVSRAVAAVREYHPQPGWVEQSADDLWDSVLRAIADCVRADQAAEVVGVGLSTQRESLVLWDRATGRPVGPLISWQDQRTASDCRALAASGAGPLVRIRSGMPLDPMFSALKARWLLAAYDPDGDHIRAGDLCLGTVDSWLLQCFGSRRQLIEVGNASRTQLLNVTTRQWDEQLLEVFGVSTSVLPEIVGSRSEEFPVTRGISPLADGTPVLAVLGDSHAALFAHAGWRKGVVKATYGTGSSVMALGSPSEHPGLCHGVIWDLDGPAYAVEGNIRSSGRTLSWLADLFGTSVETLLDEAGHTSAARTHLVPAFGGLGAPWWEPDAVAVLSGLTLATTRGELAAAALESVAHQVEDVVQAIEEATGEVNTLLADGGLTRSTQLMGLQADLSGRRVVRSDERDLSCRGAADAAGLAAGLWTLADLERRDRPGATFEPGGTAEQRFASREAWHTAVSRALPRSEKTGDEPRE